MRRRPNTKVIIERHSDGYIGYPISLKGVVVGQGDTYDEALRDTQSAIRFHIETFGKDVFSRDEPVLEAFVAEAEVSWYAIWNHSRRFSHSVSITQGRLFQCKNPSPAKPSSSATTSTRTRSFPRNI